jgi:hypothetical protein
MQFASTWVRASVLIATLALLQACYEPALPAGAPCQNDTGCPLDQRCIAASCRYATADLVDGAVAGSRDAGSIGAPVDAPRTMSCQSSHTCAAATALGTVSGDTSQQTLTARGTQAAWFRVRVTEDDDTLEGIPLRVLAKLTSPPGAGFDVLLYVNADEDVVECSTVVSTSTVSGNVREARASWGEDTVADGVDDSRDVTIEIRPITSACAADAMWELTIAGNAG